MKRKKVAVRPFCWLELALHSSQLDIQHQRVNAMPGTREAFFGSKAKFRAIRKFIDPARPMSRYDRIQEKAKILLRV